MHTLFEVGEVLRHLDLDCSGGDDRTDRVAAIRIGLLLMGLGGNGMGPNMFVGPAYKRLIRANDDELLQVFVDQEGAPRGYAILAFLDDTTNELARVDPAVLGDLDRHKGGRHPWLLALFAGSGQGRAVAAHLRDHALRGNDSLTYLKPLNGKWFTKTLRRHLHGFGRQREARTPDKPLRFRQFRENCERAQLFYDYVRLLSITQNDRTTVGSAIEGFGHATALLQLKFDRVSRPNSFLSWAMLGEETMARLREENTGRLRDGDWSSGSKPCLIKVAGDASDIAALIDKWRAELSPLRPTRLVKAEFDKGVRFVDVF